MIFVWGEGNVFSPSLKKYCPAFCMKMTVLSAFVKMIKSSSCMLVRVQLAMLVCEIIT